MKIYIYIYIYTHTQHYSIYDSTKEKKKFFLSSVKVGPHSRAQSKKFRLLWKTCTRQKKEEEKELGNQKKREKSKKETTSFCCFAV